MTSQRKSRKSKSQKMKGDLETKMLAGVSLIVKRLCSRCLQPFWQHAQVGFRTEQCMDCIVKTRIERTKDATRAGLTNHCASVTSRKLR
jgi:hypothetical protein